MSACTIRAGPLAAGVAIVFLLSAASVLLPVVAPATPSATYGTNVTTTTQNFKPSLIAVPGTPFLARDERGTTTDLSDDFYYVHWGAPADVAVVAGDVRIGGATVAGRTPGTILKSGDADATQAVVLHNCNGGLLDAADALNAAGTCLRFLEMDGLPGFTTGDGVYLDVAGGAACATTSADGLLSQCDVRLVTRTITGGTVTAGTTVATGGADIAEAGDTDGVLPDGLAYGAFNIADISLRMFDANEDGVLSTSATTDSLYLRLDDATDTLAVQTGPAPAGAFVPQVGDVRLTPFGSLAFGTMVMANEVDLVPTLQGAPGAPRMARIGNLGATDLILLTWGDGTQIHFGDVILNTVSGGPSCGGTTSFTAGTMATTAATCVGAATQNSDVDVVFYFIDRNPNGFGTEDCVYANRDIDLGGTDDAAARRLNALDIRMTTCESFAAGSVVATGDLDRTTYGTTDVVLMNLKWFDADRGQSLQNLRAVTNGAKVSTGGVAGTIETGEAAYVPVAGTDATVLTNFVRITEIDFAEASVVAAGNPDVGEPVSLLVDLRITGGDGVFTAGEDAYISADATVNAGDIRVTPVGTFAAGSTVVGTDADAGLGLSPTTNNDYVTGGDVLFAAATDFVYTDNDAIATEVAVTAGHVRITRINYLAGSTVACATVPKQIDCDHAVSTLTDAKVTGSDGAWTSGTTGEGVYVSADGLVGAGDTRLASPTLNACCTVTKAGGTAPVAVAGPNGDVPAGGRLGGGNDALYVARDTVANAKIPQLNDVRILPYGGLGFGSRLDAVSNHNDYTPWVRNSPALDLVRWDKGEAGLFNDDTFYVSQDVVDPRALVSGDGRVLSVFTYAAGSKFLAGDTDSSAAVVEIGLSAVSRVFYVNQQSGRPATYDSTDYVYFDMTGGSGGEGVLSAFDLRLKSATSSGVTYSAGTMVFAADKDRTDLNTLAVFAGPGAGRAFILKFFDNDGDNVLDTLEGFVLSADVAAAPSTILLLGDLMVTGSGGTIGPGTTTTAAAPPATVLPTLSSPTASPTCAAQGSQVTLNVVYTDSQNRAPSQSSATFGTATATMTGSGTYSSGVTYTATVTAPSASGPITPSFNFANAGGSASATGPQVVVLASSATAPTLSTGSVSPTSGTSSTSFTWTVTYTDLNNDAPTVKKVQIDGTSHDMASTDATYCDGATFTYSQTLAEGSHSYFFEFKDAASTVFLPSTGPQLVGPTVTTAPPPTTAPTETSPTTGTPSPDTSPSPTKDEPGFEAAILAMAILVAAGVLVRRRR